MIYSRLLHPADTLQRLEVEKQGVTIVGQAAVDLDIDPSQKPLLALLCTLKSGKAVVLIASESEILKQKAGDKITAKIATQHGAALKGTLTIPYYMAGNRCECYLVKDVKRC